LRLQVGCLPHNRDAQDFAALREWQHVVAIWNSDLKEFYGGADACSKCVVIKRKSEQVRDETSQDVILIGPLKSFATLLVRLSCDYIAAMEPTVVPFASPL